MPIDTVALIVCGVLCLGGIVTAGLAFAKRRPGRALQAIGVALLPVALYLSGLLGLVVSMIGALVRWLTQLVFVPTVWIGFSTLALAVLVWIVGARVALHDRDRARQEPSGRDASATTPPAPTVPAEVGSELSRPAGPRERQDALGDAELDEITALLRSRGIE